ncbi:FRG domain-containing protein [Pseudomonas chlororaphis]|uniref:FRG domain-containing protein n=1 Tax=Pseudomonas chlororaphis TaxID=587753 RepID=UPI003461C090
MKTKTIKTWSQLDNIVSRKNYRKWIYRGQSNSTWELESSLHRAFKEAQTIHLSAKGKEKDLNRIAHEIVMIDRFKCNAHLYLNHLPQQDDQLSWLSIMQHHGAPTRLLDFTFSPFVALFFALENGENDAAIYCINHEAIRNDDDQYFGTNRLEVYKRILDAHTTRDDPCLFAFEPTFSNQRLLAQQGLFVATNTLYHSHGNILDDYKIHENDALKIIISKELRFEGLRKLNHMNINSANIYPGLDGFCKSMRQQPIFGLEWQKRVGVQPQ